MTSPRTKQTGTPREPLWYPDVPARLRALLPELALSVVAMTCMTTIFGYHDGADLAALTMTMAATQLVVQTILYTCTYLVQDKRWALALPYLLATMTTPIFAMVGAAWGFSPLTNYAIPISVGMSVLLFYLMRPRAGLVALLIEVLWLGALIADMPDPWAVHMVGLAALAALLVMRSSATHITRDFVAEETAPSLDEDDDGDDGTHALPVDIYVQVAVLAACTAALCLAMAFGGTWLTMPATPTDVTVTETPSPAPSEETPAETQGSDQPHEDAESDVSTPDAAPAQAGARNLLRTLVLVLVLAALVLPFPVRLLMRTRARRALAREPRATDRAAKLYRAIIARLDAAGITRDETETPQRFLKKHAMELEEFTAPAGIGFDAWTALTDTYEKARYAGLDPTPAELETCWRIYDALPACAREAFGLRAYLIGPFWHM